MEQQSEVFSRTITLSNPLPLCLKSKFHAAAEKVIIAEETLMGNFAHFPVNCLLKNSFACCYSRLCFAAGSPSMRFTDGV
jgi:hypothetical protein